MVLTHQTNLCLPFIESDQNEALKYSDTSETECSELGPITHNSRKKGGSISHYIKWAQKISIINFTKLISSPQLASPLATWGCLPLDLSKGSILGVAAIIVRKYYIRQQSLLNRSDLTSSVEWNDTHSHAFINTSKIMETKLYHSRTKLVQKLHMFTTSFGNNRKSKPTTSSKSCHK